MIEVTIDSRLRTVFLRLPENILPERLPPIIDQVLIKLDGKNIDKVVIDFEMVKIALSQSFTLLAKLFKTFQLLGYNVYITKVPPGFAVPLSNFIPEKSLHFIENSSEISNLRNEDNSDMIQLLSDYNSYKNYFEKLENINDSAVLLENFSNKRLNSTDRIKTHIDIVIKSKRASKAKTAELLKRYQEKKLNKKIDSDTGD